MNTLQNFKYLFLLVANFIISINIHANNNELSDTDLQIKVSNVKYDYVMEFYDGQWLSKGPFYFDICTNKEITLNIYWHHHRLGTKYFIYPDEYTPNVPFSFGIPQAFKHSDSIEIRYLQNGKYVSPLEQLHGIDYVNDEDRQLILSYVDTIEEEQNLTWEISNRMLKINIKSCDLSCRISIYDMTGQQIINSELHNSENYIDLNNLHSGVYILNIFNNQQSTTEKICL